MCLIVFIPNLRHSTVRKSVLERGFIKNNDGAGFAYIRDGALVLSKGYDFFEDFYKAYKEARRSIDDRGPMLIHFRWSSVGVNNYTNTQPLPVRDNLVMAHNGTIDGFKPDPLLSDDSDSVCLAKVLRRVGWEYPFNRATKEVLRGICADESKLVFLNSQGRYTIINEQKGKWSRGAWYSDGGNVLEPVKPTTGVYSYGGNGKRSSSVIDWSDFENELDVKKNITNTIAGPILIDGTLKPRDQLEQFWSEVRRIRRLGNDAPLDPDILTGTEWRQWVELNNMVKQLHRI